MKVSKFSSLCVVSTLLLLASAASAQTTYTITDLGTLPGGTHSSGVSINASGQVTGSSNGTNFPDHPFLYSSGTMTDLGALMPPYSYGEGINASGQVTGYGSVRANGYPTGFLCSSSTKTVTSLVTPDTHPNPYSYGYALNDAGQVVGYGTNANGLGHAFLYSGGVMTDLGTLGGNNSAGHGINASGQVTGYANDAAADTHAFLYTAGLGMTDLGTLGGAYSIGLGINAPGQITGFSINAAGLYHAFLYSGGIMADLGTFPTGTNSYGSGINNSGQIVGYGDSTAFSNTHAFLYSDGTLTDLNTLLPAGSGWTLIQASAINDSGQVTGVGTNSSGASHAFLLTPPPITILLNLVNSYQLPLITSDIFAGTLLAAEKAPNKIDGCIDLTVFTVEVDLAADVRELTPAQASQLTTGANLAKAANKCP